MMFHRTLDSPLQTYSFVFIDKNEKNLKNSPVTNVQQKLNILIGSISIIQAINDKLIKIGNQIINGLFFLLKNAIYCIKKRIVFYHHQLDSILSIYL